MTAPGVHLHWASVGRLYSQGRNRKDGFEVALSSVGPRGCGGSTINCVGPIVTVGAAAAGSMANAGVFQCGLCGGLDSSALVCVSCENESVITLGDQAQVTRCLQKAQLDGSANQWLGARGQLLRLLKGL